MKETYASVQADILYSLYTVQPVMQLSSAINAQRVMGTDEDDVLCTVESNEQIISA